jgi:hypothetical protein
MRGWHTIVANCELQHGAQLSLGGGRRFGDYNGNHFETWPRPCGC